MGDSGTSAELTAMLVSLTSSFGGLYRLLFASFWLLGTCFTAWGVFNLRKYADDNGRSEKSLPMQSLVSFLFWAVFIYMPTMLNSLAVTVFGANSHNPAGLLDYQTPS